MSRDFCARFEPEWEPGFIAEAADPLATYKEKRDFDETSEPEGEVGGENKHRFVIQRHKAKRAGEHFDVRLENDEGAMSSWAIPKHRMPEGKDRLLAIKTEDHPVSYMKFKGEIPEGEYGAGVMGIHDSGTYEEIEKSDGKIVFRLKGKKEKGTYALSRTDGKKWLLTEHSDGKKASAAVPLSKRAKPAYTEKKKEDSGNITYIYTEKHVEKRNKDKMAKLKKLNKSMSKLRAQVRKDLKDSDPQKQHTALAVAIIDETYTRVGNAESAKDMKHYGLTTWLVKHVSFSGGKATIKYVGKAGVDQKKTVSEKPVVVLLKKMCEGNKKGDRLFEGEDYSVSPKHINEYLSPFGVSAKDIRGLHANEEMRKALKQVRKGKLPEPGKERDKKLKEEFQKALEIASKFVGHEPGTLKSRYLIPTMEPDYLKDGRIGTLALDAFASVPLSVRHLPLSIRKLAGAWEDLQKRLKNPEPLAVKPEWELLGIPGPFEKRPSVEKPEETSWKEESTAPTSPSIPEHRWPLYYPLADLGDLDDSLGDRFRNWQVRVSKRGGFSGEYTSRKVWAYIIVSQPKRSLKGERSFRMVWTAKFHDTLGAPEYRINQTVEESLYPEDKATFQNMVKGTLPTDLPMLEGMLDQFNEKYASVEQSAMDTLPIHADPILWSDEQLVETISNPQLRAMLEEKGLLAAVVREMRKRDLKPKIAPRDIGEWRERG